MSEVKKILSLVLVQLPQKLNYFVGVTKIDPEGGEICVIYEDGTFEKISMTHPDIQLSLPESKEGQALVSVTYADGSVLFPIHICQPVIRKFSVTSPPTKKTYREGEKLDLSGLKLMAEYETGERVPWKDIPNVDYSVKQGDAVFPLTIQNVTVPIYIKVIPAKVVAVKMGKLPDKVTYLERKETFSAAGASIIKVYDSGIETEYPLSEKMVRGFSNLTPGPQTLTVQVGAFTTTFEVVIQGKKAVDLTVLAEPSKQSYTEGEPISLDGLKLSVHYDNGETKMQEDFEYEPKTASLDCMTVKIRVNEAETELPIEVSPRQMVGIEMARLPEKTKYLEKKDSLELQGAELRVKFNFGDPEIIPVQPDMVYGFDNRTAGEMSLEVQYMGFLTTFQVEIVPQQLIGITVSKLPDKTNYAPGERFDPSGMSVSGFYNNGLLQPINSYVITPERPLEMGDVAIVVTSMDKTAVVPIHVAELFREEAPSSQSQVQEWTLPTETPVSAEKEPEKQTESAEPAKKEKQRNRFWTRFYPAASQLKNVDGDT